MKKRILSILLAAIMIVSLVPVTALAADPTTVTVAEAAAIAAGLEHNIPSEVTYSVTGYVTQTDGFVSRGQQVFWLNDTKGDQKTLEAYWCTLPENEDPLNVGDKVNIVGNILRYNSTYEMKNGDVTIIERASTTYAITDGTAKDANGSITVAETAAAGETVTVTVTANKGYALKSLKYNDGTDHTITVDKDGKYTFKMPAKAVTVTATFETTTEKPVDEIVYWGYANNTLYLSATEVDIPSSCDPKGSFNSIEGFSYDGNTNEVNYPWLGIRPLITHAEILNEIVPGSTAYWFFTLFADNIVGIEKLNTSNVTNMSGMFRYSYLKELNLSSFDTSKVTDMNHMFAVCENLESLDVNGFDTSSVTDMSSMFYDCRSLESLDLSGFDTSSVTDMRCMFSDCEKLKSLDVSNFDTSKVDAENGMYEMFSGCKLLKSLDVSGFDTSKVKNMCGMFNYCSALKALDVSGFDTSNVTDMKQMFNGCGALTSLDVSHFDTSNVGDMSEMFCGCSLLTSIDVSNFDTSKVTDMNQMFSGCAALESVDLSSFNTSQVTNISKMFSRCLALKAVDFSGFDCTNVTNAANIFAMNPPIILIETPKNLKVNAPLPKVTAPMKWLYANTLAEYEGANLPTNSANSITLVAGVPVDGWDALQNAINEAPGDKATPATKTINFILAKDLTAPDGASSITIPAYKDITLDLNGHVLNANGGKFGVIKVEEGGKLTLIDSLPKTEHYFNVDATTGLWTLTDTKTEATKTVKGGVITGGYDIYFGGVNVGKDATFDMNGGSIVGNTATGTGNVAGGGVYCSVGSSFTMKDSSICGNVAPDGAGGVNGSGSKFSGKIFNFTMTNSSVCGNTCPEGTGGVSLGENANFTMINSGIADNVGGSSGGVYFDGSSFTMQDSNITDNTAGMLGGGVHVESGSFTVINSRITDNTADMFGGGVSIYRASTVLGGTTVIEKNLVGETASNLVLFNPNTVKLGTKTASSNGNGVAAPKDGMSVGVTLLDNSMKPTGGAFTTNGTADDAKYFTPDNAEYFVNFNTDHLELKAVGTAKAVSIPTVSGGVVYTDKQVVEDSDVGDARTVTLTVIPDEGYQLKSLKYNDGTDHTITVDKDGKYTFTMPAANVTVTAEFEAAAPAGVANIADVLATVEGSFPSSSDGNAPSNAWVNSNNEKMFSYEGDFYIAGESDGDFFLSANTVLTKVGNNYKCTTVDGVTVTFVMDDGALTRISIEGLTEECVKLNGEYTAPAPVPVTAIDWLYDDYYYDVYVNTADTQYLFELAESTGGLTYGTTYTFADMISEWTCTLDAEGYQAIYATDATLTVTKDEKGLVHIVATMTLNGDTHTITYDEKGFEPSGKKIDVNGTDLNGRYMSAYGFYLYTATWGDYTVQLAFDATEEKASYTNDDFIADYGLIYSNTEQIELVKVASDNITITNTETTKTLSGSVYAKNGDEYVLNLTKTTTYTITNGTAQADSDKNHGYISIDKSTAAEKDTVTVTVKPNEGYKLKSLKYNNGEDHTLTVDKDGKSTFKMPAKAVTVTAEFVELTAPPAPTVPAANVKAIMCDIYQNNSGWWPQGWGGCGWDETCIAGMNFRYANTMAWDCFASDWQDAGVAAYDNLHFDIWFAEDGNAPIVKLEFNGSNPTAEITIPGTYKAGWNSVNINVKDTFGEQPMDKLKCLTVKVDKDGGPAAWANILFYNGDYTSTEAAIHVHNLTGWDSLYLYMWGEGGIDLGGAWPGFTTPRKDENGLYFFIPHGDYDGKSENLIFNNGNGIQLADYTVTLGESYELWVTLDGIFTEAPTSQYKYTEYENWQLKHEGSEWQWTENLVKVEEGLFKLADAIWTGSGFNVGSGANPIKKDWYAPEELTIGEELIALVPVTVDVYLRVIDDKTAMIGVGVVPEDPAPAWPKDAPAVAPAAPTVDGASIIGAALTTSYAFEPLDWPGNMPEQLTFATGETIYYTDKMTWQIYTNWAEDSYDMSEYGTLHLDLFPATGTEIKVTFEGLTVDDGGQGYKNSVVKTLTAGQWNGLDIALSEFPALSSGDAYDFSDIRYLILEGYNAEQTALSVGNVYFYGAPAPTGNEKELFNPQNARVDHTWGQFENPNATWNPATKELSIGIIRQGEWQWGNQVFLDTGITTLDTTKEYQVSFTATASTDDCGGVTFKAFDDNQIAIANQNLSLTTTPFNYVSDWTTPSSASANGLIVFDFGWDKAQTVTITNISIKERTKQPQGAIEPVDVIGGKIVSGETEVEITTTTGIELPDTALNEVAAQINKVLDNETVKNFGKDEADDDTGIIAATENNNSSIAAALKATTDDQTAKSNVNETDISKYLNVTLVSAEVNAGIEVTVTAMTFDVTPMATITVTGSNGEVTLTTEITNDEIDGTVTFLLPVDASITAETAAVYHEGEFLGNYPIKTDGGNKYIEVKTESFSEFAYITLDESTAGAKIGTTLYASLSDAVSKVANNETIKLLKDASGTITVSRAVKFTVDANGKSNTAKIVAGSGYSVRNSGNTYTVTMYNNGGLGGFGGINFMISQPANVKNGKLEISPKSASAGQTVTLTVTPDNGFALETLTVLNKNGKEVKVENIGDGKFSFTMPSGNVTISATFQAVETTEPEGPETPAQTACPQDETCVYAKFTDADTKAWYHDGVHFCVENGYMQGVSATAFNPSGTTTRAMIVTMLWRMEGEPVVNYAMSFKDVAADQWYTEAIRWANSIGLVEGYNEKSFGPNDKITREQMATILYRYAKYHEIDVSNTNTLAGFTDVNKVSAWALDAMKWANAIGLVQGRTTTTLVPEVSITRAEAATMVQRYCEAFKK